MINLRMYLYIYIYDEGITYKTLKEKNHTFYGGVK